jgi:hypothetical protein
MARLAAVTNPSSQPTMGMKVRMPVLIPTRRPYSMPAQLRPMA